MTPLPVARLLESALMDCRPIEVRLVGFGPGHRPGAEELARELTTLARRVYRGLGGQDVVATAQERGGALVLTLKPRDDPPDWT